jgi:ParB family chromosome partitioning protein
VTETIESWIDELKPAVKSKRPAKVELVKGRAHYSRKGSKLNLELSKVDDELAEQILQLVKQALN